MNETPQSSAGARPTEAPPRKLYVFFVISLNTVAGKLNALPPRFLVGQLNALHSGVQSLEVQSYRYNHYLVLQVTNRSTSIKHPLRARISLAQSYLVT